LRVLFPIEKSGPYSVIGGAPLKNQTPPSH
jgi:hypothetical protein